MKQTIKNQAANVNHYNINNTKLANSLVAIGDAKVDNARCDNQVHAMLTSGTEKQVTSVVFCLAYTSDEIPANEYIPGVELIDGKPSGYDMAVHDAICTICANMSEKEEIMSYIDIYRVLSGDPSARPADYTVQKIRASVQRLRRIRGQIDFRQEPETVREYFKIHNAKIICRDALLYCGEYLIENHNTKVSLGIRMADRPVLLKYALSRKQLISVPSDVIAVPLRMTDKTVAIRNYLCKYVVNRKNGYLNNKIISYRTILSRSGIEEADTWNQRKRDFDTVCTILAHFQDKDFITSFEDDYKNMQFKIVV